MGRNVLLCNQHIHSYHSFLNFIFMLCYIWCLQWWPGLVVRHWSRSMYLRCAGRVSTRLGDHLWAGKPSQYIISNPGQLSLSMPPWVGALSTSESWGAKRHIARGTSPVFIVWQCKLVCDWDQCLLLGLCGSGNTRKDKKYNMLNVDCSCTVQWDNGFDLGTIGWICKTWFSDYISEEG